MRARVMKLMSGIMGLTLGVAGMTFAAEEAAPAVGATLDLPVLSGYVWRGQVLNDEAVVQPSLTVVKGGFSLNVWGNFNLTDAFGDAAKSELSEIDLTAGYAGSVGNLGYSVGVIEYLFPHQTFSTDDGGVGYPGTREIYAGVSLSGLPVVPALTLYYDIDEADALYALLGLSAGFEVMENVAITASASVGYGTEDYNAFYFGFAEDGLNDGVVGISAAIKATPSLVITPAVQYIGLLDSDIENAAEGLYKDSEAVVVSLKATYTM